MKRAPSSASKKSPGREAASRPGRGLGPGGLSRQRPASAPATAPDAAAGGQPASRHGAHRPTPLPRAARILGNKAGGGERVEASYISAHERSPRELVEEGFGLPAEGVLLTYLDRRRGRSVARLFPSRPAAEAWARGSGEEAAILPLGEALVR